MVNSSSANTYLSGAGLHLADPPADRPPITPRDSGPGGGAHPHSVDRTEAWLNQLRYCFWNGQRIPLHRALRRLTPQQTDLLSIVVLPIVSTTLLWFFWNDIALFMLGVSYFFLDPLIQTLQFAQLDMPGVDTPLYVPRIRTSSPSAAQWWIGYAFCAGTLLFAALPLRRWVPLRHFAAFFGTLQLAAQLYAALGSGLHTVQTQDYLVDAMQLSIYWIAFTPWLLGLTFNLFPFTLLHKARITALAMCHQLLLLPVQFALQAWILHEGSALWVALLFFATGLPFNILTTVCFYGIGLAWPHAERADA